MVNFDGLNSYSLWFKLSVSCWTANSAMAYSFRTRADQLSGAGGGGQPVDESCCLQLDSDTAGLFLCTIDVAGLPVLI